MDETLDQAPPGQKELRSRQVYLPSALKLPIDSGIDPESEVPTKNKLLRLVKADSEVGSVLRSAVMSVKSKISSCPRSFKLSVGKLPVKNVDPRYSSVRFVSPFSPGNGPFNGLCDRLRCLSVEVCPPS